MRRPLLVVAALAASPSLADAAPHRADPVIVPSAPGSESAAIAVTKVLYLDRCVGGCKVHGAIADDATTNSSSIPPTGDYTVQAFAFTDAEWAAIVSCVKVVYSPYAITITDNAPTNTAYNKSIVAGIPGDVGLDVTVLGIALLAGDCHPLSNAIAFAFANAHPHDETFIDNVCWTVAQESAHLYGLDHEYVFTNGVSACSDPMTYRTDCGGEKFFRPHQAHCGRVAEEPCRCGTSQSSHRLLLERFGSAAQTSSAPVVDVTPLAGPTIENGLSVIARASAQRGVDHVDLRLNGFVWATVPGVAFDRGGQPAASYTLTLPADVPDGVIDVVVAASDDLGVTTASAPMTVTKGVPCTSATTCAAHQACDDGKCHWAEAAVALGDACTYAQQCTSGACEAGACTEACDVEDATTCPADFACVGTGMFTDGECVRTAGGGCCDAGSGGSAPIALTLLVAAYGRRRRR